MKKQTPLEFMQETRNMFRRFLRQAKRGLKKETDSADIPSWQHQINSYQKAVDEMDLLIYRHTHQP